MTNAQQEAIGDLQDALDLLAQAEDKIRSLGNTHLNNYVANQIDTNNICMGEGLAKIIMNHMSDLEEMEEEEE